MEAKRPEHGDRLGEEGESASPEVLKSEFGRELMVLMGSFMDRGLSVEEQQKVLKETAASYDAFREKHGY